MTDDCPFCDPEPERVFLATDLVIGLWDKYPVSSGHALLVSRRHVADWFQATAAVQLALVSALPMAKEAVEREHQPQGYNIGINIGQAAGQTVFHLHLHLIPRYKGDQDDPRGGVRLMFPDKARYWTDPSGVA